MSKWDDQIARNREELERHPPGDTGRAEALYNLAIFLGDRFQEINDVSNLEEAAALQRSALALCPTGHPDRHRSLYTLV